MDTRTFCFHVASRLGMTREEVHEVFQAVMVEAQRILAEGDEFRLPGIGKLFCKTRAARSHLDRFKLRQGIEVVRQVPPRRRVNFEAEQPGAKFGRYRGFEKQLNTPEQDRCTK